jgi:transcriptional regulator with XRE-family HTH domain
MATKNASPLKEILSLQGLTHAQVAAALVTSPANIAKWERDIASASVSQIRDLAIFTGLTVDELFGQAQSDEEEAHGPFAANPMLGVPYGALLLTLEGEEALYPIDQGTYERLRNQLSALDIQEPGHEASWLHLSTLDNRLIFANAALLKEVELVSDDDEEMPEFEHPEVYNALEHWDEISDDAGPVLRARCEAILQEADAEERLLALYNTRFVMRTGEVKWHPLLEAADTLGYYVLELEAGRGIPRNRFIQVRSEAQYRAKFVNLSNVALIEVPTNLYLRLAARDE